MKFFDYVKSLFRDEAKLYLYVPIPADRVHGDDTTGTRELESGGHYFRLWLTEMMLAHDRDWFTDWYPATHSVVAYRRGGKDVELPHVAGPRQLDGVKHQNLGRVVQLDHALTPLLPFNADTVRVSAGLLAVKGGSVVERFLGAMGTISKALAAGRLSAAVEVASTLSTALLELVQADGTKLHLGLERTFTDKAAGGANVLREGYVVVVLAEEGDVDPKQFRVVDGRLRYGTEQNHEPPKGHTAMLFRVEAREERGDWDQLPEIAIPFDLARSRMLVSPDEGKAYMLAAISAAWRSENLTRQDRIRVAGALKTAYEEMKDAGLGAFSVDESLTDLVARAGDAMSFGFEGLVDG